MYMMLQFDWYVQYHNFSCSAWVTVHIRSEQYQAKGLDLVTCIHVHVLYVHTYMFTYVCKSLWWSHHASACPSAPRSHPVPVHWPCPSVPQCHPYLQCTHTHILTLSISCITYKTSVVQYSLGQAMWYNMVCNTTALLHDACTCTYIQTVCTVLLVQ